MGAVIGGYFGRSGRNQCGVGRRDPAPAEMTTGFVTSQPSIQKEAGERWRVMAGKYAYIPDNYNSLDQVTKNADTNGSDLSPQEEKTINSIVTASYFPLSIILVGVGDGPWEDMHKFDDRIPARAFDNFQFVNFSEIMAIKACSAKKEAAFALAAFMEVPLQYKATKELGLLGVTTEKAKNVIFYPPPQSVNLRRPSHYSIADDRREPCPICWTNAMDLALGCGHTCCRACGNKLTQCPVCRANITSRLRLYTGEGKDSNTLAGKRSCSVYRRSHAVQEKCKCIVYDGYLELFGY
ncbi:E3 ubiquitin-protein ligase RGLG4-like isoform X2 [Phalaenopsis equestris]|uniref:E3 ubiquitin-protein ligase RGLG4-like isoform X2 n=1 Tax=Phalaenopsis equestris TaxID=78828 RepID=UPI0009E2B95E|nr:E3 ubiquitin-protein ligase RGLG4-like isoform X2 [Phalaenopsis equestris]